MNITAHDVDILARTIYGEARGEDRVGQLCVGWVVKNRATRRYRGEGIAQCCQARMQFSCWNAGDPNYDKLLRTDLSDPVFREAFRNALSVLEGDLDPTNGSTHYCTVEKPKNASMWPPAWAKGHAPVVIIGRHAFYKDIP